MAPKGKNGKKKAANKRRGRGGGYATNQLVDPDLDITAALLADDVDVAAPVSTANETVSDDSEDLCWICTEKIKYFSISECNHTTCHVCALRMRALYKRQVCTFCKLPQTSLIITSQPPKPYQSYDLPSMQHFDRKLSMYYDTGEMLKSCLLLLRSNCPNPDCDFTTLGWVSLKRHVRDCHDRLLCDLCISHKKIFAHEHTTYTPDQYPVHMPSFQRNPNHKGKGKEAVANIDIEIHPMCTFCQECFYGDDELHSHLRGRHEECFVCKNQGIMHQYFQNWRKLDLHFKEEHHPCIHTLCQEQNFIVFSTETELEAHLADAHGDAVTKKNRRKAQRLEVSFATPSYAELQQENAQNIRARDRDTYSAGGWSNWGAFDDSWTSPSLDPPMFDVSSRGQGSRYGYNLERSRQYATFIDHVRSVAPSVNEVTTIRQAVTSWRSAKLPVYEMLETIFMVLDWDMDKITSVVTRLLDISEGEDKEDLSEFWNAFFLAVNQRRNRSATSYDSSTRRVKQGGTFWDHVGFPVEEQVQDPGGAGLSWGSPPLSGRPVPGSGVATPTISGSSSRQALASSRHPPTSGVTEGKKSWAAVAAKDPWRWSSYDAW